MNQQDRKISIQLLFLAFCRNTIPNDKINGEDGILECIMNLNIVTRIYKSLNNSNKENLYALFVAIWNGRYRNLYNSNGQIVTVDSKKQITIDNSDQIKKRIVVNNIAIAKEYSFWIKQIFNDNAIKGIVYIANKDAKLTDFILVNKEAFKSWITNLETIFFQKNFDEKTDEERILNLLGNILREWQQHEFKDHLELFTLTNRVDSKTVSNTPHTEEDTQIKVSKRSLLIFCGPPGTGKTTRAKKRIIKDLPEDQYQIVQIHPSYGYEELVEGLKPVTYINGDIKYEIVDGPVKILAKKATKSSACVLCFIDAKKVIHLPHGTATRYGLSDIAISLKEDFNSNALFKKLDSDCVQDYWGLFESIPEKGIFTKLHILEQSWGKDRYVLLLDEINRGHIATILGELVFALSEIHSDDPKPVKLQHSGDDFKWPEKLSLIGTMNTADTTTDRIDQAIKRRFEFEMVNPLENEDDWKNEHIILKSSGNENIVDFIKNNFQSLKNELLPWNLVAAINKALYDENDPKSDARKYGAFSVKEKLIGHSYFIKYIRLLCEKFNINRNIDLNDEAESILSKILKKEIYPAMLNIFNSSEESYENFKKERLQFFEDIAEKYQEVENKSEAA